MEYKIETDLNNEIHLVRYENNDGIILFTGSFDECKKRLIDLIKSRHRVTHITFSQNRIFIHDEGKELSCKEFCNFE